MKQFITRTRSRLCAKSLNPSTIREKFELHALRMAHSKHSRKLQSWITNTNNHKFKLLDAWKVQNTLRITLQLERSIHRTNQQSKYNLENFGLWITFLTELSISTWKRVVLEAPARRFRAQPTENHSSCRRSSAMPDYAAKLCKRHLRTRSRWVTRKL